MKLVVVGAGAVGMRAARQLASTPDVELVTVTDLEPARADAVVASLGPGSAAAASVTDAVIAAHDGCVLATPSGSEHVALAAQFVAAGRSVVSVSDDLTTVKDLRALSDQASAAGSTVVVGAGFSPGLTCLLAAHAGALFDPVHEVHVARSGTGGPACAHSHHRALGHPALDWRDGAFVDRPPGSGRELCWFPEPVGALDCYRAAAPDSLLLQLAFPDAERITARVAANRRDRLTAWLPMLRPPHPEGLVGAVRVEVRGLQGGTHNTTVYGAVDRPGVAAGAVSAVALVAAVRGELTGPGAGGLATLVGEPLTMLKELARRGVKCAVFEGLLAAG